MQFWQAFLLSLFTAVLGFFGGYLNYKHKLKSENVHAKRERLLKNIYKAEDYIHMLVESGFLEKDMQELKIKMELDKAKLDELAMEQTQIGAQIKVIESEKEQICDQNKNDEYITQLNSLFSRLSEIDYEFSRKKKLISEFDSELGRIKNIVENHKLRLINDDIDSTLFIIDPSGEIIEYVTELMDIYSNPKVQKDFLVRKIELRLKINKIFDDKINEIN